jgi:hypothetical protein
MTSSINQQSSFCETQYAIFSEGGLRISQSFGILPKPLENADSCSRLIHRVKLFVTGFLLCIPVINIIVHLAMQYFSPASKKAEDGSSPAQGNIKPAENQKKPVTTPQKPVAASAEQNSELAVQPNDYSPVPLVGLPNFGIYQKLFNTCWMNSACQAVFRSLEVYNRLIEVTNASNPPPFAAVMRELVEAIKKYKGNNRDEIDKVKVKLVDHYATIDATFREKTGEQYSPNVFLGTLLKELKLSFTTSSLSHIDREGVHKYCDAPKEKLVASYTRNQSYEFAIKRNASFVKVSKVPRIFCVECTNFSERTIKEVPEEIDFRFVFNEELQKKHSVIRYRLATGTVRPNVDSVSGHYTAQQRDDWILFNDSIVSYVQQDKGKENMVHSSVHIWEIVDTSQVAELDKAN